LITSIYQQLISLSSTSAYNLFFLLLPTEDAFPLLVLFVPCFSEAAREQHPSSFPFGFYPRLVF